jgi:hypothetical protein
MKPGTRKALTGKKMRVATTFTGAAACAIAFAPHAAAATTATHRPLLRANTTIRERSCTASRDTWLHIYNGSVYRCFGYTGTLAYLFTVVDFCGGENSGYLAGSLLDGDFSPRYFSRGTNYVTASPDKDFTLSAVDIVAYTGSDAC